jgi:hydrogenase maturation protein HypF
MSSQHTVIYFKQILDHYAKVFNFKPQLVVTDLHPDFFVTNYAREMGIEHLQLQHHYAHFASVLGDAESFNIELQPVILGCILDGYGYGLNGEAWGGELIKFTRKTLRFKPVSQIPGLITPGGDIAEKEPWRLALALCLSYNLPVPEHIQKQPQAQVLSELISRGQFAESTSMGRLFSAVAAMLGVVTHVSYEAEAAMMLESLVTHPIVESDFVRLCHDGKPDLALLIQRVYQIGIAHNDVNQAINIFYGSLAALLAKWILYHASLNNIRQVALSGGCWQSRYLLPLISEKMDALGIELLIPQGLPFNDECISFGQAWYDAQTILHGLK